MEIVNKNPNKSECIEYITMKSIELGIPVRLSLAIACIESNFIQFNEDGSTLCNSISNDFGIMQITIGAKVGVTDWAYINEDDWNRLLIDWKFNIDMGLYEVQSCYILASRSEEVMQGLEHFKNLTAEDCIARATYSAYNGGPQKISRYRNPITESTSSEEFPNNIKYIYDYRDINFWSIYNMKSWEKCK